MRPVDQRDQRPKRPTPRETRGPKRPVDHSTQNSRKKDYKGHKSANSRKKPVKHKINLQTHHFEHSWPEKPGRFVSEDFRKTHTDDTEASTWALFNNLKGKESQELRHPVRLNNDTYIIYHLKLKWGGKRYNWLKFKLFTSEDDINCVLDNCYELKCSEDILNVIVHYASVGENHSKYLMLNGWIYKLYPKKLYVFLVGKQLTRNENADKIKKVIEGQHKKHEYKDIREGISNCKENNQDLYVLYAEYAQYFRETLLGIYTHGTFDPNKEAWFTTYFLATVISESARNFRSFIITLIALDLSQDPETQNKGLEFLLEKLPMAKGGTWINSDRRGFHGASTVQKEEKERRNTKKKKKEERKISKLKRLVEKEEEIFKTWLSVSSKTEIDTEMIKRLLKLLYGKLRLNKDPSILETFIINLRDFKKEINSLISPELLRGYSYRN
ncbi:uncharacterized protein LOC128616598 [Ictalurus furcatus]|uniref:uncharacterized protein LOC128616598 n=1 Tax=Ictalurus furcatus TaxID=66913 RepID=UPI00235062A5|nr:uncharacterized protein LOC128616598 [Ictalurus furcatus]